MPYTQTEYLAGFLAVACLALLWCWYQKKQDADKYEGMVRKQDLPGLRMREGMTMKYEDKVQMNMPGLRMAGAGYVRPGIEGLDTGSAGTLNDANNSANPAGVAAANAYQVPPMVEAKWNVDSDIQIPLRAATNKDVDRQMLEWGGEIPGVDTRGLSRCDMNSVSLGGQILTKTDYEPQYGPAKGAVTY